MIPMWGDCRTCIQAMNPEPDTRFSDEWLDWAEIHGNAGDKHAAPFFRQIPADQRARASLLARAIGNRQGMNYSGAVWCAIAELARADFKETPTETWIRESREREQAAKDRELLSIKRERMEAQA